MAEITIGTVPSITRTPWSRKSDWLTMPSVSSSEEKVVILHAVREESEFVAFTIAGAYTVDWGDGTVENFATGATAEHEYDYTNVQLDGTLTSGGYKQALIIITPQAGQNLTNLNFQVKHSTSGLQAYSSGFLDIILSGPNLTSLTVGGTTIGHRLLERAEFLNIGSVTTMQNMFYDCTSLQSVPLFDTSSVTNMSAMFYDCNSLQSVPLLDTSSVTNMSYMFLFCYSLQSVPLFDTSSVTNMQEMFRDCTSLQSVPLFDTSLVTNMYQMFLGCTSLQSVPLFDTSSVTNMKDMFRDCTSLQSVPAFDVSSVSTSFGNFAVNAYSLSKVEMTGISEDISFANCKLSGTELDAIYTALPTVVGKTITVTGNYGTSTHDPTIATDKGWIVTN